MALPGVSNTIGTVRIDVDSMIARAMRRAMRLSSTVPAEVADAAPQILYTYLTSLANRGVQLWCVDRLVLGILAGVGAVPLPAGTVDVLEAAYRQAVLCAGGTGTSSAGGNVAAAFDGLLGGFCQQTSPNGWISYAFPQSTAVTTVGWNAYGAQALTPVIEASLDGVTWSAVYTPSPDMGATTISCADGQWVWRDLPAVMAWPYWRLRETGGATLSLRQLQFAVAGTTIPMARFSLDTYAAQPRTYTARTVPQFFLDRQADHPVMRLNPVSNYSFDQIVVWRHRHIMDPGGLTNLVEAPVRWMDAITKGFALELAEEMPPDPRLPPQTVQAVLAWMKSRYEEALALAELEERDNSPFMLSPGIEVYTRS